MHKFKRRAALIGDLRCRQSARAAIEYHVEQLEVRLCLSAALPIFGTQQAFNAGPAPSAIHIADMNLDGKPDLVVANDSSAGTVGVLLGNGDGTFQPQQTFATGSMPDAVAVGDFNSDGKPDIVVANSANGNVSVLLGNAGGFQAQLSFTVGAGPSGVVVLDANQDGKLDLAVANRGSNTVSVLLGNGNGTFQAQKVFATGAGASSIATGDVNRDGKADLLVSNAGGNSVSVLLGTGSGTFLPQQTFATGANPASLAVADINSDGRPDLVTANSLDNSVSALLGNGDGTFAGQQTFAVGTGPDSVTVADINRDGKLDIVTACAGSNAVCVLVGNGDGTFQPQMTFAAGASPLSVALADLNSDGRVDVAVANVGSETTGILLAHTQPTVLSINRVSSAGPIISGVNAVSFSVSFNGPVVGVDATDFSVALGGVTIVPPLTVVAVTQSVYIVTASGISGIGSIGLNLIDDGTIHDLSGNALQPGGTVNFGSSQSYPAGIGTIAVTTADLNGDGKADLVVDNTGNGSQIGVTSVLLGNGDGTFQPAKTFSNGGEHTVAIADVNGDGRLDIVMGGGIAQILLGNGDGTFASGPLISVPGGAGEVAVGDFNGDGRLDLAVTSGASVVTLLSGKGDGSFQLNGTFAGPYGADCVVAADLNQDGKLDLAYRDGVYSLACVLLGNGDGTFRPQITYSVARVPDSIAVGDLNADGKPDLVLASRYDSDVAVLVGNGDGSFQAQRTFGTGVETTCVKLADVNGDGHLDIAATNEFDGTISVLLGNGDATFQQRQNLVVAVPLGVVVADVNSDGRPDLIVAQQNGGTTTASTFSILLGSASANAVGQAYNVVPSLDIIDGSSANGLITLSQDIDHVHIDWTLGSVTAQMRIDDANGLTINGSNTSKSIGLNYTNGNPLPNRLNLNGVFNIALPTTGNPLGGTTLDLGKSTLIIPYDAYYRPDPTPIVINYLKTGYNDGLWNGTSTNGAIISSAAGSDPNQSSGIGYLSVPLFDGQYNLELKYTLYGDSRLTGSVGFTDFMRMTQHYTQATGATWATGDFNYDGAVNDADFALLQKNYGQTLPATVFAATRVMPLTSTHPARSAILPPAPARLLVDSTSASVAASPAITGADVTKTKHPKAKPRHH